MFGIKYYVWTCLLISSVFSSDQTSQCSTADLEFKDKVVIVTGASSGIGAVTARRFGKLGAKVVLVARSEGKLQNVSRTIEEDGGFKPLVIKADLTKDDEVSLIINDTIQHFQKIDVLVNNAGAGLLANIESGIEPLDKMIALNLRSVYLLTHLAAPHLSKTKGTIINVSSVAAIKAFKEFTPYCVAKAALDMFTKCAAIDLADHGIRVNSVNPGPVKTGFLPALGWTEEQASGFLDAYGAKSPLGHITTTDDVVELITFLASQKAKAITGSIHVIDSGELLKQMF